MDFFFYYLEKGKRGGGSSKHKLSKNRFINENTTINFKVFKLLKKYSEDEDEDEDEHEDEHEHEHMDFPQQFEILMYLVQGLVLEHLSKLFTLEVHMIKVAA